MNVLSADGDDYNHVHPEYTSFAVEDNQTDLGVDVTFLQPGVHLVTASWVVELSSLNLYSIERIKHAHGLSNNAMLYPLLSATWTVDVASGSAAVDGGGGKLPPEQRLLATSEATLACGKPASLVGAYHTYNHSYELAESVTCCCSAASSVVMPTCGKYFLTSLYSVASETSKPASKSSDTAHEADQRMGSHGS